ncbi:hypothetical protein HBI81_255480 [Parastagonospora nodorum]|nr:hypothetical protein HBI18_251990 [Parastagonospora nodorum]KAH6510786.1 hypothetical protein HBI81_255480 [Parastagonospora nodorum]
MPQDMLPTGGYSHVQYKRNLPVCGFRPAVYILRMGGELAREKMCARIYLTPVLQAEVQSDQVRKYLADNAREKELLSLEIRIYNSDRCPKFAVTPENQTK